MYPAADWQKEKVKKESEATHFERYLKTSLPAVISDVNLRNIVGTDHVSYNEGNWLEMLAQLPKRSTDEQYVAYVRDNPDHSFYSEYSGVNKQPIVLHQYGDEYFICGGGNHRICHAKFAGLSHIRVEVEQHLLAPAYH